MLTVQQDGLGFWYLTDNQTGYYVSPPLKTGEQARNLCSRAEVLLHIGKITNDDIFDWANDAIWASDNPHLA